MPRTPNDVGFAEKTSRPKLRCAIYTRKSTTEGLEQEFNSLDAQRESCEKYIESQRGEGWRALPEKYDDGGFTGGNTERPALQKLLSDIRSERVDCVVVYKVDRLSRSLLDFAKLMELFEKHGIGFVSVTQQFNTSNSMGRLTLNILLSFAQFEREIIGERTRDKIAAAKMKGKWIGGTPPLGYDIALGGRRLVVNQQEKKLVREIFDLYLQRQSLMEVVKELRRRGRVTKRRKSKKGREFGGQEFQCTTVQHLLSNPIFTGKVRLHGKLYPGEHEAIIPQAVWDAVEEIRQRNAQVRTVLKGTSEPALLKGFVRCKACGTRMVHTHARKGPRRYRYYVCVSAQKKGYDTCPSPSLNAQCLEDAALASFRKIVADPKAGILDGIRGFFKGAWERLPPFERIRTFRSVLRQVEHDSREGTIRLVLSQRGIRCLQDELAQANKEAAP